MAMKKKKKTSKKAVKSKKASTVAGKSGFGTPYGDRVLVKPAPAEEVTSCGIIIPESGKENPEQGTVVAVGPGKKADDGRTVPLAVAPGDKIMFSKYGYDEVKIDGEDYYILAESNVLGIVG